MMLKVRQVGLNEVCPLPRRGQHLRPYSDKDVSLDEQRKMQLEAFLAN